MSSNTQRFMELFEGLPRAYGVYTPGNPDDKDARGKLPGQATTVRGAVTPELVDRHLAGSQGLGLVPIRDDGTCRFGAIDIDVYDGLDPARIAAALFQMNLPLIACRSKSGGVHVYLFTSEPVSAAAMQTKLREIAVLLGHGTAEIFPKQIALEPGGFGGWINLPYFQGDDGTRYGVRPDGAPLNLEQFIGRAEELRVGATFFSAAVPVTCDPGPVPLVERTPMARLLEGALEKLREGDTRNNTGLWHLAQVRDAGYTYEEARASLTEWVRFANEATQGQANYTLKEARETLKQVYKRKPRAPWATKRPNAVKILEELCRDITLFHSPKKDAFALVPVNGHTECVAVDSKTFKGILTSRYFRQQQSTPGRDAMQSFVDLQCARAVLDGPERETHLRFAHAGGRAYLDLANDAWEVVEIDADGWRVLSQSPVCFRRAGGMKALPTPETGGHLDMLRGFLNAREDSHWVLIASWLVGAFLPKGGIPILLLQGSQGSAKSTTATLLRNVIDPATVPLSAPPRDERELAITAVNSGLVVFDNLSGVHPWLSDALCRIATGAGFRTRTLHTDSDEQLFETRRPLLLNGIDDIASRADLLDRGIGVTLGHISDERRRTEEEVYAGFNAAHGSILGALLTAVSQGLKNLPETRLSSMPRMADFAKFIVACESALPWKAGTFMLEYMSSRQKAAELSVENDPVAQVLWQMALSLRNKRWEGRAGELLAELNKRIPFDRREAMKSWPTTPASLGKWLRRAEPGLLAVGVTLTESRHGRAGARLLRVEYRPDQPRLLERDAA